MTDLERLALTCQAVVACLNDFHPVRLVIQPVSYWNERGYSVELGYELGGRLAMYRILSWKELLLDLSPSKGRTIGRAIDAELVDFYRYN